jgi:leucine dehydrogenase
MTDEAVLFKVLEAFGQELLPDIGTYLAAEDVGTTPSHMKYLMEWAPKGLVTGYHRDVSEVTAQGVVLGIEVAIRTYANSPFALWNQAYAVQGVGSVGKHIVNLLYDAGARDIAVTDATPGRAEEVCAGRHGIHVEPSKDFHKLHADVLIPCALGGTLNSATVEDIEASIVAGCANNQLKRPEDGERLYERGIMYAPDFIINAGGLIAVVCDSITGAPIETMLPAIKENLVRIFTESKRAGTAPSAIADELVRERVSKLEMPI